MTQKYDDTLTVCVLSQQQIVYFAVRPIAADLTFSSL